jgi:hypothetical protein
MTVLEGFFLGVASTGTFFTLAIWLANRSWRPPW